jgi:glycosyltransferase involved in cell wall biosynthesis
MLRACILLSTYNGERFLLPQIRSLLAQKGCSIQIVARDDGSTDGTVAILKELSERDSRITVYEGENRGVIESFFWLLENASTDFDGYFFCDQDDVWDDNKVAVALGSIGAMNHDVPTLYCSRVRYVDSEGQLLGLSRVPQVTGLGNALVENIAYGCTVALNPAARDVLIQSRSRKIIMHDWWCYLVMAACGAVIYDKSPRINYRLHAGNVVGANPSRFAEVVSRLRRRVKRAPSTVMRSDQAGELLRLSGEKLTSSRRAVVENFVAGKKRFRTRLNLVLRGVLRSGSRMDQAWLNLQVLLNDY